MIVTAEQLVNLIEILTNTLEIPDNITSDPFTMRHAERLELWKTIMEQQFGKLHKVNT